MDCPLKRFKGKGKKKAMKATWSDSDSSSSDEECANETNNLAFMAIEDNHLIIESEEEKVHDSLEYDELIDSFNELSDLYDSLATSSHCA